MNNSFGLEPFVLEKIKSQLLDQLEEKKSYQVFVFGSRAKGSHKKYSDLDLFIISKPSLTHTELSKLKDAFEESDLAIKIDLVVQEYCLTDYLPSIHAQKVLWFERQVSQRGENTTGSSKTQLS